MKKADWDEIKAVGLQHGDRCSSLPMNYKKGCKVQVLFSNARVTKYYGEFSNPKLTDRAVDASWEATVPALGRTILTAIGYATEPASALLDAKTRIESNIQDLKTALWQIEQAIAVAYPPNQKAENGIESDFRQITL